MALLMSFFVMVAAYSTQDQKKLQLVAGSMRDAFGVTRESRYAGIVEQDGIPTETKLKNAKVAPPEEAADHTTQNDLNLKDEGLEHRFQSRLRARRGVAAPGAAGHAGDRRALEEHHH